MATDRVSLDTTKKSTGLDAVNNQLKKKTEEIRTAVQPFINSVFTAQPLHNTLGAQHNDGETAIQG